MITKMKQINKAGRKTILSVSPDKVVLNIGTDIKEDKLEMFISILDELITGIPEQINPYYGHFYFSNGSMEVTLSGKKYKPAAFDLTYRYEL